MGSENTMNDVTSFQPSDKPILCANGCGFFGTAATMNFCSKCYRDLRLEEEQAASAKAAVEKSMSPASIAAPVTFVVEEKPVEVAGDVVSASASSASPPAPEKPTNRCASCNKKISVMGFKCRCGSTFCGSHRFADKHECTFDFKGAGKDAIAKANPVVKADKLERF